MATLSKLYDEIIEEHLIRLSSLEFAVKSIDDKYQSQYGFNSDDLQILLDCAYGEIEQLHREIVTLTLSKAQL